MSDFAATFIIETILNGDETKVSLRATARFVKQSLCTAITSESIDNLLQQRGFGRFSVNEEQISEIISALNEAISEIKEEADTNGFVIETDVIAEALDATAAIEISEDKLQAVLTMTPAQGGRHLALVDIELLLEEAGVTYGIEKDKIETLIRKVQKPETHENCDDVVATALLPVRGDDAQFIPLVDTANERVLKPRLRDDGTVDMLDLGDLPTVAIDTEIMRKEPATKGTKGMDVCWNILSAEPGNDITFKMGPGTKLSDEDELVLLSAIAGQPNLQDRGMKVDDVVQVKAVDLSTGHLNLDSNLLVKGDIIDGMKVRCKGDITVGGVVESADVRADGNIIIGKGVLGRTVEHSKQDQKFTVSIEAKGFISAIFASYASLKADGDVLIAEQILHCKTISQSKVIVGNEKTVGSQIVGGSTSASVSIETDILGASAGVLTKLDLNGSFDLKHYELSCNHSIFDAKRGMLDNMRNAYSKFVNLAFTASRNEHITKIKNTITFLENEIAEIEKRTELLLLESEELCHGLSVKVKQKIYSNVVVTIGHDNFRSSRVRASGEIFYEDSGIHYKPAVLTK